MGVVYKLKPEIVSFIVEEKKKNRTLSCRALATIIETKFQKKISKSSINDIFKRYQLSSPTGRSTGFKPSKNFFIPQVKKDSLKATVTPWLKEVVPLSVPRDEGTLQETLGDWFDDAGAILWRVAIWGLSQENILGPLFRSWFVDAHTEALSLPQWEDFAFQCQEAHTAPQKLFFHNDRIAVLQKQMEQQHLTLSQEIEWESTIQSLLFMATKVKIMATNGEEFFLDAQLTRMVSQDEMSRLRPLYRVMEDVVDSLISPVRSLSLQIPSHLKTAQQSLQNIFHQNKIAKIQILDMQNNVLHEHTHWADQVRTMIIQELQEVSVQETLPVSQKKFTVVASKTVVEHIALLIQHILVTQYMDNMELLQKIIQTRGRIDETPESIQVWLCMEGWSQNAIIDTIKLFDDINARHIMNRQGRIIILGRA